ncbi:MAG: hypothetical protein ACFE9R_05195 [Candidatus Hermodarchaeota archaeon]
MSVFIILLFIMTYVQISFNANYNPIINHTKIEEINKDNLNSATGLEIFQDPFRINFSKIWTFFDSKYNTDLDGEVDTYYRYGNNIGTIISNNVSSFDNLLLYKSLLQDQLDYYDTFDTYLKLQETALWYQSSVDLNEYGFVHTVDGVTGEMLDSTRYLIDNVMPILLLFDNIGFQVNSFTINSKHPTDSIDEMFNLIDSEQFWDDFNIGFYHHNATNYKYTESNFYAILALLKIHNYYTQLGIESTLRNRAFLLANLTINKLLTELWDSSNGGFDYYGKNDWSSETGSDYKYLEPNALAILGLTEYWRESGMQPESIYIQRASYLFNLLEALWNSGFNAYVSSGDSSWDPLSGPDSSINLGANSIMMLACLKLFECTGNITYYNRAFELYETFENSFYDTSVNSYDTSIDSPIDSNKNFEANLKAADSYNNAFKLYNSTVLNSVYNVTDEIPNYIFNQDFMNLTSGYSFTFTDKFYNTSTAVYEDFTVEYNINDASITYLFKNPSNEIINQQTNLITSDSTTLLYNITDDLKIGQGYSIYIFANSTNFGAASTLKQFNVFSGLINSSIQGLPSTLYQGPIVNITLPVNNTRNNDVELSVSLEGTDIVNQFQSVLFLSNVLTNVSFNLTTILDANIGLHTLNFTFKKDNITYLEIIKTIQIGHSFDYTNFLYKDKIVANENALVSLTLINFLPNNTQTLNISFFEQDLLIYKQEILLQKNEIKTLNFFLAFSDTESHSINAKMEISKGVTTYYSKAFIIELIQKFEILSVGFPEVVAQGESAHFILVIQNNQQVSESFSLYVNGEKASTNINRLSPGENIIETSIIITFNPYDFQSKSYIFELTDSNGDTIASYYFVVSLELSAFNLIMFYILPLAIPIVIILFYKNKEIKHRLLKR